jgi:hypothetical protein
MASPQIEVIVFYDLSTGAPLSGLTPTFEVYEDDLGNDLSGTAPTISEIGVSSVYKFTPAFADPDRGIIYVIDAGATANPRRVSRYMRPEDWATDDVATAVADIAIIKTVTLGKWEIKSTGGDANHLILYEDDGVTVLQKFLLTDVSGVPTYINPFKRSPV